MSNPTVGTIDIPAPHHDLAALGLHRSGTLSICRSSYAHWRKRRAQALRSVSEKMSEPFWPQPPEDAKDAKAVAEYRRKAEWAYRKGRDQRRALQAFLLAVAETDRRTTAAIDEASRTFGIAAAILRGEPVSRAARRDIDSDVIRQAEHLRDEIDALGLADDPAVQERVQALVTDLDRQAEEAKAALAAMARQHEDDRALMEKVAAKAARCFARIDAHHLGLSDDAAELYFKKTRAS